MSDKQKTVHSSGTNHSGLKPSVVNIPDRSQLAELYPQPKTYGEKAADSRRFQRSLRRQWPKYPYLNIAAYGSLMLGLTVWFSQNLSSWWFGNPESKGITMSVVFFTFALGLGLAFLIVAWVSYVNKQLSYFGGTIAFWLVFGISTSVLTFLWFSGWFWGYTYILWIPILSVLHFVTMFISTRQIVIGNSSKFID